MHSNEIRYLTIFFTSALLGLALYSYGIFHQFFGWNLEDSYIIYRIVENLHLGNGWRFNLEDVHNASTSVLNTVVLWLASTSIDSIPATAHIIGSLLIFIISLLFILISYRTLSSNPTYITSLAISAFVIIFYLARDATWGLETHLFVALLLTFIYFEQRNLCPWYILGLLVLARPDGLLVLAIRLMIEFYLSPPKAIIGGFKSLCILLPWITFSVGEFEQIFPDTLSNKIWQGNSGLWGSGYVYLNALIAHLNDSSIYFKVALVGAFINYFILLKLRHPLSYLLLFGLVQQLAYIGMNVPGYHWYFAIFDIGVVITCADGVLRFVYLLSNTKILSFLENKYTKQVSCFVPIIIGSLLSYEALKNPQHDSGNNHYLIAANKIREDLSSGVLGVVEVGTLGFLTKRKILDLTGLTTPNPEMLSGENNDLFFESQPELVLFHDPIWSFERALFLDPRFNLIYRLEESISAPIPLLLFKRRGDKRSISIAQTIQHLQTEHPSVNIVDNFNYDEVIERKDECLVERFNGTLFSDKKISLPRTFLTLSGWAVDRDSSSIHQEIEIILESRAKDKVTYSLQTVRASRPDLIHVFSKIGWQHGGFMAQGHLLDIPSGAYRIVVVQRRNSTNGEKETLWCEPNKSLVVQ